VQTPLTLNKNTLRCQYILVTEFYKNKMKLFTIAQPNLTDWPAQTSCLFVSKRKSSGAVIISRWRCILVTPLTEKWRRYFSGLYKFPSVRDSDVFKHDALSDRKMCAHKLYSKWEIMHCCLTTCLIKWLNCQMLTVVTMVTLFHTFLENDP
jgi:hypothetical protein